MSWPLITFSVIPFQRDLPSNREDPTEMLIWRALKVGNSCCCCCCGHAVLPAHAPRFQFICLFFVPTAFLPLCPTCVFCSILTVLKDKACISQTIPNFCWLCATDVVWFYSLQTHQISKKDAGVYEVVLKDERGKDTSTLNLTDQGKQSEIENTEQPLSSRPDWIMTLSSRFQRSDEWSVRIHR